MKLLWRVTIRFIQIASHLLCTLCQQAADLLTHGSFYLTWKPDYGWKSSIIFLHFDLK